MYLARAGISAWRHRSVSVSTIILEVVQERAPPYQLGADLLAEGAMS
jgi:hypothetical protein